MFQSGFRPVVVKSLLGEGTYQGVRSLASLRARSLSAYF